MKKIIGNIWSFKQENSYLVVPTNLGYTRYKLNVMGRGIAFEAQQKFPELSRIYGEFCYQRHKENKEESLFILGDYGLILFPTKKLLPETPQLSWKQNSDIVTIENSCKELLEWDNIKDVNIYMPLVGCGNGKLSEKIVLPVLEKYFGNFDNIFLVSLK